MTPLSGFIKFKKHRWLRIFEVSEPNCVEATLVDANGQNHSWSLTAFANGFRVTRPDIPDFAILGTTQSLGNQHHFESTFSSNQEATDYLTIKWNIQRVFGVLIATRNIEVSYQDGGCVCVCDGLNIRLSKQCGSDGTFTFHDTGVMSVTCAVVIAMFCWWVEESRYVAN